MPYDKLGLKNKYTYKKKIGVISKNELTLKGPSH
jgi:hypothetical protein